MAVTLLLAVFASLVGVGETAADERKVALVIGNSQYGELSRLANAAKDARDIAAALGGMGFSVSLGTDLDEDAFAQVLDDFAATARGAEVALFFYAGHGLQLESENYLIPVDARLDTRLALKRETFPLDDIVDIMAGAKYSLIFIDACRSFPIEGTFFATGNERVVRVNGPAPVEAARDSFIGFSASPGQVALDGNAGNSPFASAMLEFLPRGGVDVSTMFTAVSNQVRDTTRGAQVPQSWGNLSSPLTLLPAEAVQAAERGPSTEERAYLLAREVGTEAAYIAFIARYPGGFYTELAKAELDKLAVSKGPPVQPSIEPPPPSEEPSAEPLSPRPATDIAALIAHCDELGGDPYDKDKVGDGVVLGALDTHAVIAACEAAIVAAGDAAPMRTYYQLGRAQQATGDVEAAYASYEIASAASVEAWSQLGHFLRDGTTGKLDVKRAVEIFRDAAAAGSVSAMAAYARAFENGQGGLRKNEETASDWYKRAADQNYPPAMHALANMYRDGRGVAKNMQRAMQLYDGARARGLIASAYNLAWLLDVADGVDRNSRQAAQYFMDSLESREARFVAALQRDGKLLSVETRRALQQALKDGGYYSGPIDGAFGPGTNRAIAAAGGQG